MAFQKFNVTKYAILGAFAGLITYIVAAVMQYLNLPTAILFQNGFISLTASTVDVNLRNSIITAGNFNFAGNNILSLINATGFDLMAFISVILGGIVVAIGGRILFGYTKSNKYTGRMAIILSFLFGVGALGLISSIFLKLDIIGVTLSMLLFGLILGIIMQIFVQIKSFKYLQE